ncbi:MAG: hypothetical protein ACTHJ6_01715 [Oryzihumus sp.]
MTQFSAENGAAALRRHFDEALASRLPWFDGTLEDAGTDGGIRGPLT